MGIFPLLKIGSQAREVNENDGTDDISSDCERTHGLGPNAKNQSKSNDFGVMYSKHYVRPIHDLALV
jgi:hypothetical protein